ncbi:DUF6452 family protein [Capnocytophaga canimorsus]|uniref:Lipoprotein n=1 Tax=Capnocytophaga canimorsus (strain 5) TaxID=860228 RepID=F9YSY8_CAPCC|nr:DUF6452 family protein [Capnocytophaga canimorsus]AEK22730.1 Conserved hypothetical protein [Capnocytophaga canimorsus Cc5]VEJ20100.1 Uncharacterised protein [Capnocytophaga canimorsus]
MKKKWIIGIGILTLLLIFSAITACEPDDLCEHKVTTPQLILRLKDTDKPTKTKAAEKLLVYGKDQKQILSFTTTDSLALPLKISEPQTTYLLVKDATFDANSGTITSGEIAIITFSYQPEEQFVSKGCGFKVVYHNLKVAVEDPTSVWIKSVRINKTDIEDEKKAQVTIYH